MDINTLKAVLKTLEKAAKDSRKWTCEPAEDLDDAEKNGFYDGTKEAVRIVEMLLNEEIAAQEEAA
jgi:hypothetical protein